MKKAILLLSVLLPLLANGQIITTVAGDGSTGYSGDNDSAILASIGSAGGIVFDVSGNYYVSENNNTIRKISNNGIISKYAGTGTQGYSGDGGLATSANLYLSGFMATDSLGNLYFSEIINNRIRKVDAISGIVSTVVGNGTAGFSGDGSAAVSAQLNMPYGICFDKEGNLYIVDQLNYRIRKVNTSGIITTVAGTGIGGSTGDGGLATLAKIYSPIAICVDQSNNLYFTDSGRVRKINTTTGVISAYAGSGAVGFAGDGASALTASFSFPQGLAINNSGNLYISDDNNDRIRKVDAIGIIHTVAGNGISGYNGDGGKADTSALNSPRGIALDSCGNLYIVDNGNHRIRKVAFNPSCLPTEVKHLPTINAIAIYPNPAKEQLTITGSSIKSITVLNAIGQVLIEQMNYSDKAIMNVGSLASGVYFVKVSDRNGNVVVRRFGKE
ncbi:MAG: T9SS type A sorting domain-containing protein [Bacteroidetes bacterium]|nr:T9SS type A sorting domain-containing protein [Bacteroidota bacterium]